MFKKTLIAGAVLAASTGLAFANGGTFMPPAAHHTGNFYAGAAVSRDFVHFDTNQRQYDVPEQGYTEVNMNVRHDFGDEGWNGEIFAGYGATFQNHYYLAAEVFGSLSNVDTKYDLNLGNGEFKDSKKIELRHSYGISFIPGVKLSQSTMLYGRVGWVRSQFEVNGLVKGGYLEMPYSAKKDEDGVQVGIGFETMVCKNFSLRGEYDWSRYNDLTASAMRTCGWQIGTEHRYNLKADHPTVNQFKLAAVYHFVA